MTTRVRVIIDKLFKDESGRIVIWQNPNIPLWVWIISVAVGLIIKSSTIHNVISQIGSAAIFTWAYLEIRSGASLFRRIIGAIVMIVVIYGFFTAK